MILLLTSHIGGCRKADGQRFPEKLMEENGLLQQLKARWTQNARVLFIASAPEDAAKNDALLGCFAEAFPMSGLDTARMELCDARSEALAGRLAEYDVILLSGGHVPTQNAFFEKIRLRERLQGFKGLVIGISAGTMNCAGTVYAQPELLGEACDPAYRRFLPGLGLTETMVLPHWQAVRDETLDGLRIYEDITLPDSCGRTFYALNDGSYILSENGTETLYGEACRIRDGHLVRVCENGRSIRI